MISSLPPSPFLLELSLLVCWTFCVSLLIFLAFLLFPFPSFCFHPSFLPLSLPSLPFIFLLFFPPPTFPFKIVHFCCHSFSFQKLFKMSFECSFLKYSFFFLFNVLFYLLPAWSVFPPGCSFCLFVCLFVCVVFFCGWSN